MKKRVLIALAVLGTVFITACGGNGNSASPSQDDNGAAAVTPTVTQEVTPHGHRTGSGAYGGDDSSAHSRCGRRKQYIRR